MDMSSAIDKLNKTSDAEFLALMHSCCASDLYSHQMLSKRPFRSIDELLSSSSSTCNSLPKQAWLSAFSAHPQIGAQPKRQGEGASEREQQWSSQEQAKASESSAQIMDQIRTLSQQYMHKHGFVFLICATDKTGQDILDSVKSRIHNETEKEISNAIREHVQITRLRLIKGLKQL